MSKETESESYETAISKVMAGTQAQALAALPANTAARLRFLQSEMAQESARKRREAQEKATQD